jgi:hypothetical protein
MASDLLALELPRRTKKCLVRPLLRTKSKSCVVGFMFFVIGQKKATRNSPTFMFRGEVFQVSNPREY